MPLIRRLVVVMASVALVTVLTWLALAVSLRIGGPEGPGEATDSPHLGTAGPAGEPRPGWEEESALGRVDAGGISAAGQEPPPAEAALHPELLSVTDAQESERGWIVLDGRASRWHLVGKGGALERSVGRSGDGPGEMQNPVALALLGDTILVGERTRGTVERFHLDGHVIDRIAPGAPGCPVAVLRQMAVTGDGLHLLRECIDARTGGSTLQVHRVGRGGTSSVLAVRSWLDMTGAQPLRLGAPVLVGGGPLLLFGDAQSGCLVVLSPPERKDERVCHPRPPRIPLAVEDRVRLEAARQRLSLRGLTLELPRFVPPFDGVFLPRPGEVVFRTGIGGNRYTLARWSDSGALGGGDEEEEWGTPLLFLGASSLLVAGETLEGTWVLVRPRG